MEMSPVSFKEWEIFALEGDFSIKTLVPIRAALDRFSKNGTRKVAFDFAQVTYIDSSAIGLMTNFAKQAVRAGGRLALFNVQSEIMQILNMVSFNETVPVFESRQEFEKQAG